MRHEKSKHLLCMCLEHEQETMSRTSYHVGSGVMNNEHNTRGCNREIRYKVYRDPSRAPKKAIETSGNAAFF